MAWIKRLFLCIIVIIGISLLYGCDEYQVVNKNRYALIDKNELAQLKKEADIGKSIGRYQIHRDGHRTWRLDTATGQMCILLTTDADWKKTETKMSACD